jgi:predicted  nucleic acid-binding Zn-ribbon protein
MIFSGWKQVERSPQNERNEKRSGIGAPPGGELLTFGRSERMCNCECLLFTFMKRCIECGRENEDTAQVCAHCGAKLQDRHAQEPPNKAWERIAVINNEVEAERLDLELENRSIPHVMRSYRDSAWDGLYQLGHGWGEVEAPLEQTEMIKSILQDIREAESAPTKDQS